MFGGTPTGKFATVLENCCSCAFYQEVRAEEPDFMFSLSLLSLRKNSASNTVGA